MEGGKGISGAENGGSSYGGKPPNPLSSSVGGAAATACKLSLDGDRVVAPCNKKSLVRHPSLVKTKVSDISVEDEFIIETDRSEFVPSVRSGAWSDIGSRPGMEDVSLCIDDFMGDYGVKNSEDAPSAFYGVFDGHGGKHAADFASNHLPRFIVEDEEFPNEIKKVLSSAFLRIDTAFAEACASDAGLASGTTALAALILGRLLVVANAGDCRAVLCRRGKAIEMSRDHKPGCSKERKRIEESGGYVSDGYLNGQLNVSRAIGDFHMEGMKKKKKSKKGGSNGGGGGPLIAEPEVMQTELTEEDEFLVIGCDGVWDVFTSQNAVDFARRRLQEHNDPEICSKEVIEEAVKRKSRDNMTAVVVCLKAEPPPSLVAPRSRVHRSFSAEGLKELQSLLDSLKC